MANDSWALKAPMAHSRSGLGVIALNGNIFAIGGATANGFCNFNEEYNITTGNWTSKAPMPVARSSFAIAVSQNKIYCIGGYALINGHGMAVNVNEAYDPTTDTWSTKAPMPTPELNIRANEVGGKIYIIGGNNNGALNQVYDPLIDSWTTKASIPTAASSYASAIANGKIYVFTNNLTQVYSPSNDSWSYGTPSPLPIILANAAVTSGVNAPERIYVFGVNAQLPYWQLTTKGFITQSYDPINDSWQMCSSMQIGRYDIGVASVNDLLYLIGGYTSQSRSGLDPNPILTYSTANEQYTPLDYSTTPLTIYSSTIPESPFTKTGTQLFTIVIEFAVFATLILVFVISLIFYRKRRKQVEFV